jgi:hypothetical protein
MEQQVIEAVREAVRQIKWNLPDGKVRSNAYSAALEALLWVTKGREVEQSID